MSVANSVNVVPLDDAAIDHAHADFIQVRANHTIQQALEEVRRRPPAGRIIYFYVIDSEGRLAGVVPTRRLLLNDPDVPISDVMVPDPVALPATATVAEACELFLKHRFLALPIVGPGRRMLGVIDVELYTEEISDMAHREEAEDFFQLIGVRLRQMRNRSLAGAVASRFPWLLSNVSGGIACALLAAQFDGLLKRVVALSLFMTVVLAIGESVSVQSLSITLQGGVGLRRSLREWMTSIAGEAATALCLGLLCGLLIALVSIVWQRDPPLAAVLLLSLGIAVMASGIYGRLVPGILGIFHWDPKVASGPIVLAITDLTTLLTYFSVATWLLT